MLEVYKKYKSMQIALTSAAHRQGYVAMVKTEPGLRCDEDIVCFIAVKLEQLAVVYPIFISRQVKTTESCSEK